MRISGFRRFLKDSSPPSKTTRCHGRSRTSNIELNIWWRGQGSYVEDDVHSSHFPSNLLDRPETFQLDIAYLAAVLARTIPAFLAGCAEEEDLALEEGYAKREQRVEGQAQCVFLYVRAFVELTHMVSSF